MENRLFGSHKDPYKKIDQIEETPFDEFDPNEESLNEGSEYMDDSSANQF